MLNIFPTKLIDCFVIEPKVFSDNRGFFLESFNEEQFQNTFQSSFHFVQDNHSRSLQNVLRGLHYQILNPQGKLVRVTVGEVYDVVVDLRQSSSTFGIWDGFHLSAENKRQLWIPPGFAHGFLVLSEIADFLYKTTDYYYPEYERCLLWSDTQLNIKWPLNQPPLLSEKDKKGKVFKDVEVFK